MAGWGIAIRKAGTWVWTRVGWKAILKIGALAGLTVVGIKEWNDASEYLEEKKEDLSSGLAAAGAGIGVLLLIAIAAGRR